MAIEKKSLISTLKTTKKANVASTPAVSKTESTRKALTPSPSLKRGATPIIKRALAAGKN